MGTKNTPSKFDCYANAEPDEEMFILLGRDPTACLLVTMWVAMRLEMGASLDDPQIEEARACARKLNVYAKSKGKDTEAALLAWKRVIIQTAQEIYKREGKP